MLRRAREILFWSLGFSALAACWAQAYAAHNPLLLFPASLLLPAWSYFAAWRYFTGPRPGNGSLVPFPFDRLPVYLRLLALYLAYFAMMSALIVWGAKYAELAGRLPPQWPWQVAGATLLLFALGLLAACWHLGRARR
jgi:hypothetical protein